MDIWDCLLRTRDQCSLWELVDQPLVEEAAKRHHHADIEPAFHVIGGPAVDRQPVLLSEPLHWDVTGQRDHFKGLHRPARAAPGDHTELISAPQPTTTEAVRLRDVTCWTRAASGTPPQTGPSQRTGASRGPARRTRVRGTASPRGSRRPT